MKKYFTLIFTASAFLSFAQNVNQVIVLNEGYFDFNAQQQVIAVSIGAYNPVTHQYVQFDQMSGAQYSSDVLVDGNYIYAACSNGIYKYEKSTKTPSGFVAVTGVRKMAVWQNQLLITRGDVGLVNNYFQAYDKNTLSFIYELDNVTGPQFTTEGIVVNGDTCYIALNNAFNYPNYTGIIGVVHLPSQSYVREFSLGAIGINPDYMAIDNGTIYTLNNRDYTNASVSIYNTTTAIVNTVDLSITTGCSASQFANDAVYYQVSGQNSLFRFDVNSQSTVGSLPINNGVYGMAFDKANNLLYAGNTDYFSYGKVYVYDLAGIAVDSFNVSVSPGSIAIDYATTGVNEITENNVSLFPNPVSDVAFISLPASTENIYLQLLDVNGKVVLQNKIQTGVKNLQLELSGVSKGVYILQVTTSGNTFNRKIVKQ